MIPGTTRYNVISKASLQSSYKKILCCFYTIIQQKWLKDKSMGWLSAVMNFFLGVIFLGRVVVPSPKIVKNLSGTMLGYPIKENPIGSAVSEIRPYKHKQIS